MQSSATKGQPKLLDRDAQEIEDTGAATAQIEEQVDHLLSHLRSGIAEHKQLALKSFADMAFQDQCSSRAAQLALDRASISEQTELFSGLQGSVRRAMQDQNANHVITKAVEVMPADRVSFIGAELLGHGSQLARHRFGCRVLCRILEHLPPSGTKTMELLEEVLEDADNLCTQAHGSIVMCHFLEHGLDEHKHRIAVALGKDLVSSTLKRKGSQVVEAAIRYCSFDDCQQLSKVLLEDANNVSALATGQFSRHVVAAMLVLEGEKAQIRKSAIDALSGIAQELPMHRNGKTCLELLQRV